MPKGKAEFISQMLRQVTKERPFLLTFVGRHRDWESLYKYLQDQEQSQALNVDQSPNPEALNIVDPQADDLDDEVEFESPQFHVRLILEPISRWSVRCTQPLL